jgi:membrane protein required for colicin V production
MDFLRIDPTDIAIIITIFCFGLFSIFRGFVKEFFSTIGWVAAVILAIYLTPLISLKIDETLPSIPHNSLLIGILIVFFVYVLFRILGAKLQKNFVSGNLNTINGSLGFLLGIAKGYAVICLILFVTKLFLKGDQYPIWMSSSKSFPLIESTTMALTAKLPMYLKKKLGEGSIRSFEAETKAKFENLNLPKLKSSYSKNDTTYNRDQRKLMDRKFKQLRSSQ